MTLSDFRNLLFRYSDIDGQPYLAETDTTAVNALINERLKALTDLSLILDARKVALTLVAGTNAYDYQSSSVAVAMSRVENLYVNGEVLRGADGYPGPFPAREFDATYPTWPNDSGVPTRWIPMAPHSIYLHPAPSSVLSAHVSGQRRHVTLTSDSDSVEIPDAWIRGAVGYVWVTLNRPWTAGDGMAKLESINQQAARELADMLSFGQSIRCGRGRRRSLTSYRRIGG